MDCIYIALLSKALCNVAFTHSCTHSHTDGGVSHARRQPARQEQLGLGALLRDTSTLAGVRASNLAVGSQSATPLELLPNHVRAINTFSVFGWQFYLGSLNLSMTERKYKMLQHFKMSYVCRASMALHYLFFWFRDKAYSLKALSIYCLSFDYQSPVDCIWMIESVSWETLLPPLSLSRCPRLIFLFFFFLTITLKSLTHSYCCLSVTESKRTRSETTRPQRWICLSSNSFSWANTAPFT